MRGLAFLAVFLLGCVLEDQFTEVPVEGYVPVYGQKEASEIKLAPSRSIVNPGKIYTYQNFLFVNEHNQGVHVFDNQNPSQPLPVTFIEILGNNDIAVRNDILYADHMGNIAAVSLNEFQDLEHLSSLPLNNWLLGVPPPSGFNFECVDTDKGLVIAWKKATLTNPDCYAF